ncbi:Protein CBG24347 [Caenorhabditis briggsae]|uniref:Protein CBG24347 n=1 Tax=Caenorhabditis briggsae TaxID=6238 RepID=A8WKI2_CAEBR|nr:Protein CBG24347 [Caenorhabditis briggsae]CAP20977.1 Protein CBG24347 [Caenorhabditis briggsae]
MEEELDHDLGETGSFGALLMVQTEKLEWGGGGGLKGGGGNSKSDGPVEWALWTMREMIKNDKEAKLKFRRCGLNSAVKKLRRKDNKALMDLRSEVLKR